MIGTVERTAPPPEPPRPPFSFTPEGFPGHRVLVLPYKGMQDKELFTAIDAKIIGAEINKTDAGDVVWIFLVELAPIRIANEPPITSVFDYREMMKG